MKDYKILKFLDIFKALFEKIGVDYPVMRKILNVKLTLDSRRPSVVVSNQNTKRKKESEDDKNNFFRSLGLYFLMGFFLILYVIIGENFLFQMSLVFSIIMFLLMTALIADFSSVLLDTKEKLIILSRPVDHKTFNIAKILHIIIYISMITFAIAGPSLIASLFRHGLTFFLIYLSEIVLASLFSIIITALIYLMVLKYFSGERLKDIINYVQIGLTITISLGYQVIVRIFNFVDIHNLEYKASLWKYFIAPIWFSGPFELLINKNYNNYIIIYTICALIVPILSILIYIKLVPSFERYLLKLDSADGQSRDKNRFIILLSKIVCRDKEERSFFKFATKMMRNERTFKLKVYPSLGMAIIFPFFMIISMNFRELSNLANTKLYLWIYMTFMMIPTVIWSLEYSGNYKGAWIFETIPIKDKSAIKKGTLKAAIVSLFLPVFLLVSLIFLIIYRMQIVDQILVVAINLLIYTIIVYRSKKNFIPFSKAFEVSENTSGARNSLSTLFLIAGFALSHYILTKMSYGTYIYIVLGCILSKIYWKKAIA